MLDENMFKWQKEQLKKAKKRFKPKLSDNFEFMALFFLACLSIIFRPLNIIIGGLLFVLIYMII